MKFAMISYKEAIHMSNVCKTVLKKPFKCELCEQKFKIKHFNMYNFEKSTKCILCDQKFLKKSSVCRICGEGFEKYVTGRTKVQSERNWHHVRLGSTYTVT